MASETDAFLAQTELQKIARSLPVPTNDERVRLSLQALDQPVELPDEAKADRRERLGLLMAKRHQKGLDPLPDGDMVMENAEQDEEFFTQGTPELLEARKVIFEYSREAARLRLNSEKELYSKITNGDTKTLESILETRRTDHHRLASMEPFGTQSGFSRPVSALSFNDGGSKLAVGDWSGTIQVLDGKNLEPLASVAAHAGQIRGLAWGGPNILASGGFEGDVVLHDADLVPQATLKGHKARVAGVDFHPSKRFLATASYDHTWHLWDVETQQSLLVQEGHSKEVYAIKNHPDGSLVASAGLDAVARVWDLRIGQSVMILDKHIREIYAIDWSSNGYTCATGGADNNIMIWDIRKLTDPYLLPAHTNIVSDLHFNDKTLVSASYDHSVRVWAPDSWRLLKKFTTSERVMSVSSHDTAIALGRWDRTVDMWKQYSSSH